MISHTASRLPVCGVFGSGSPRHGNPELAYEAGRRVALAGWHLLTGGGRGVMADASRGFTEVAGRSGVCLGILPAAGAGSTEVKEGYPNPWVEVPVRTHLAGEQGPESPTSRNWINALSAERILALPGGAGTEAELRLACRLGKSSKVLVLYTDDTRPEEAAFHRRVHELGLRRVRVARPEREDDPGWREVEGFLRR